MVVDVLKSNFLPQLSDFLRHLPSASFVAIDEEMTGISLPERRGKRPDKIQTPGERYAESLKGVPERYAAVQVGVALFRRRDEGGETEEGGGGDEGGGAGAGATTRAAAAAAADGDEHAFLHREGMLNQDELEDLTEREEEGGGEGGGERTDEPKYTARVYNFYLFPRAADRRGVVPEREVTLNPSTVQFLLENGMDFQKVFREGINCATLERAKYLKRRYFDKRDAKRKEDEEKEEKKKRQENGSRKRARVKLTRAEDIAFVARTMATLREWIDADGGGGGGEFGGEGSSLVLPPCNAFLRRALYETVEVEYPMLTLERADANGRGGGAGAGRNQIRALRLTPAEKERRDERLRREEWDRALTEAGFAIVFEALSDACRGKTFDEERTKAFLEGRSPDLTADPASDDASARGANGGRRRRSPPSLIVHNGLMDLMFLLTHCHDPALPEDFEDVKAIVRSYFPSVVDTKVLATEYSDAIVRGGSTTLGDLFDSWRYEGASVDSTLRKTPAIENRDEDEGGGGGGGGGGREQAHEAAWDAYMTGCVYTSLVDRVVESKSHLSAFAPDPDGLLSDASDELLREWIGLNKLYAHASIFTVDLESRGDLAAGLTDSLSRDLSADTTFHVSGIDASVSTRDVLQALWRGNESDDEGIRNLKYEIMWVDDASFFVGTRLEVGESREGDASFERAVARHVREGLRAGLGTGPSVASLGEYLRERRRGTEEEGAEASSPSSGEASACSGGGVVGTLVAAATRPFRALGSALGLGGKRSREDGGGDEGKGDDVKRRRMG
ncbi:hypothetical protein ACHAWF_003675 [Thalassiosira exigua]